MFDPKKKYASSDFDPIPANIYPVRCREFKKNQSKKKDGGEYLNLEWEIVSGEYKGRRLWSIQSLKLNIDMVADRFANLIISTGHTDEFDPDDMGVLHKILDGSVVRAKVITEEYVSTKETDSNGSPVVKTKNSIEAFMEASKEDKAAAAEMEAVADAIGAGTGGTGGMNKKDLDDIPFGG
jgi:hypothetical protein